MEPRPRIPQVLSAVRAHMGVNQARFGALFGVPQGNLSLMERGKRPFPEARQPLLDALLGSTEESIAAIAGHLREGRVEEAQLLLSKEVKP